MLTLLASVLVAGAEGAYAPVPSAAAPVAISPAPGTPDASPATQISILGLAPQKIESVSVTGSISGAHPGRLAFYRGAEGASFILGRPLTQGETVVAVVRIAGRAPITDSFTVARLGTPQILLGAKVEQPAKLDHFVTAPAVLAPKIRILKNGSSLAGDIFLTPLPSPIVHPQSDNELTIKPVGPGGPMIIDRAGRLVWFDPLTPPLVAADFRPQRFDGHEVLTWWQGGVTASAFGEGEGVIASTSYRVIRTVKAGNGYAADLHEFLITPAGDALLTVYSPVLVHLPGTAPGSLSPLLDSIVQEVDIRTGLVIWEWHALGRIPLSDSYATPATSVSFDAFHLNSIQPLPAGRLLVSARDTSAVYEIDQATGQILWTLGGKASSFRLGAGARFYFQHDAEMLPADRLSLFDDEAGPPIEARSSRGLILALNLRDHTAAVAADYRRPGNDTLADSEGNMQSLAGGDEFVGWGATPFFSQFTAGGQLLFDAALPVDDGSYRVFRDPWSATPQTRPAAVGKRPSRTRLDVWVSWNGATDVARWQVLAGGHPVAIAPDTGFETRIAVSSRARTFTLRALNAAGRTLGTSNAVHVP
jgi:Arylsulfotransferase (ASST)